MPVSELEKNAENISKIISALTRTPRGTSFKKICLYDQLMTRSLFENNARSEETRKLWMKT
ncbi:MAG: hypothetical protein ACPGEF_07500, partial [Endozoicomonas sp.]